MKISVNLDIFWLKDDALEESSNLPAPEVIAQEITDDLEAAMEQFAPVLQKSQFMRYNPVLLPPKSVLPHFGYSAAR